MKPTILIVDDEPGVRSALTGVLQDEGYLVESVATGEACLDRVTRAALDLIVLDVWLPGMDGLATLARLRERQVDVQVVLISGHGNIESAVRAIKLGASTSSRSPALEKRPRHPQRAAPAKLEAENRALRARVDRHETMVGELRDWPAPRAGRDGGADKRACPHLRRERDREGTGGAHDSRPQSASQRGVRGGELRRHP
jgi:two-component system nitrogen regulation response regulator NtrX